MSRIGFPHTLLLRFTHCWFLCNFYSIKCAESSKDLACSIFTAIHGNSFLRTGKVNVYSAYSEFLSEQRLFCRWFEWPKFVLQTFWVLTDWSLTFLSDKRPFLYLFEWPKIVPQSLWVPKDCSAGDLSDQRLFWRWWVTKVYSARFLGVQRLISNVFGCLKIILQRFWVTKDGYPEFLGDQRLFFR